MKTIITIAFLLCSIGVSAQIKIPENLKTTGAKFVINGNLTYAPDTYTHMRKLDTVQVLAYCIDDFDTPSFSWKKLYAVYGFDQPSINMNDLMIYKAYLMQDRKTPVNFKVVYAINKP